jgi:beta-aspartyl-peptidase (threonine type)
MIALIVHGGCHDLPPSEKEKSDTLGGLRDYGERGFDMLRRGSSAIDTAETVISLLEDDPAYDAGTGSFKNLEGKVEMDALIMDSKARCGGVQCIQNVQHPISIARLVMEKTPHNLLSGAGAEQFARRQGIPAYNPGEYKNNRGIEPVGDRVRLLGDLQYYSEIHREERRFSTVGIAVLDESGLLVAATSTGGIRMKMPGRVSDAAVPGAGTFCGEEIALSATGEGEGIMRLCLTYRTAMEYQRTGDLTGACKNGITAGTNINCICGIIAVTRDGKFSWAHNGVFMPVYYNSDNVS